MRCDVWPITANVKDGALHASSLRVYELLPLKEEEEEEEFYKLLPANKADHLCQLWQSCSDLHEIQTVYDILENPHSIRLSKK